MKHYAKIISFANHKGGVGKTTTTASMGSILASKGYKVLLVDLDAQANLTSSLLKKEVTTTIYDGLKSQSSTSLYIYKVREDIRLDMIPADLNLAQAPLEATNIVDYDKKSNGAQDYIALTEEFLERMVLNNVTISK